MKILFDSSALFKRYAGEAGTRAVLDLHAKATSIVLAPHCLTELMSALTRQWREGAFGDAEFARVRSRMREDFNAYRVEPLNRVVEDLAIAAMALSPLRAMDALHIGAAQAARVHLFVTSDRRQAAAAQAAGLRTECIEA
jgi:predicted nucleic acid-binding protein